MVVWKMLFRQVRWQDHPAVRFQFSADAQRGAILQEISWKFPEAIKM